MAKKNKQSTIEETTKGGILVKVYSLNEGLSVYENVSLVRLSGKDQNLLILHNYLPLIGKLDGSAEIVTKDQVKLIKGIRGFYMFRNNQFDLLIEEDDYVQ